MRLFLLKVVSDDRKILAASWVDLNVAFPPGVGWCQRKGPDMADKSPRKASSKKPSKSLKEKRREKKDKEEVRRRIV